MTAAITKPSNNTPARRVNYDQKPGSVATLKTMLEGVEQTMANVLPRHLTAERMVKLVLVAANRTPKLLQCRGMTIIESVMRASELGLDCSGTLGEAYLVPYKDTCQLIPGYRGLAKLARQSGEVKRIEAEVVYEADHFKYRKGAEFVLEFEPSLVADRGEVIGAYALVEFKDGGIQADFLTASDIERVRQMSMGRNAGPWKDHWDEMAKKTVFRRLAKWLPLSSEKFDQAVVLGDAEYRLADNTPGLPSQTPTGTADDLNAILDDQPDADSPTDNTDPPAALDWQAIVAAHAKRNECAHDDSSDQLVGYVSDVLRKDIADLTDAEQAELAQKVAKGELDI
ncbi:MAG: recombinase RecT [Planctomycetota bacterium]